MTKARDRSKNSNELHAAIERIAKDRIRPDDSPYRSILFTDELQLAAQTGYSHKEIQLAALEHDIVPERYARNQKSLSCTDQVQLLNSHAVVIGLGGLGGTVTEILARLGVGTLTLVDGDRFEDSNLNRQLLSSTAALGKKKADIAAARVKEINPAVTAIAVPEFFDSDNGQRILGEADIAVDCLDTIAYRFILEEACNAKKIPLVSAAIGGTSGQATVVLPEDPGLKLIYGSPEQAPKRGVEASLGTLPHAAIAMAAIECAEVVALALGRPAQLRKQLLFADFAYYSMETVSFD